jgi:histidine triad (HIT) family protein
MGKKLVIAIGTLAVIVVIGLSFFMNPQVQGSCPFCSDQVLKAQVFYEDSYTLGLLTYKPVTPGHLLIIPKRHVEHFEQLSPEEVTSMLHTIQKVHLAASKVYKTGPYLLHQKNGKEVGQSVAHLHVHYIPLKAQSESLVTLARRIILSWFKSPMSPSEMEPVCELMKEALGS